MTETTPAKEAPVFQAPKKKSKWPKRILAIILVVAIVAAILVVLFGVGTPTIQSSYMPATAAVRNMTVAVSGPGTIKPNDTYRATALVKGEVLSAPFEEGDIIQKDDVLFVIDSSDVETAIKQAEIGLGQAEDSVERSQASVRQAQLQVEQAQLQVDSAQINYNSLIRTRNDNAEDRQVKANATGVVNKLYVDPGDTVSAGTPIADILDRENMKLEVPFHSVDAANFYVGQSATVTVSGTAETLYGTVSEIAATDTVGNGGALVRSVTITVTNPGALSNTSMGSASVGGSSCASSGTFRYAESKQLIALYSGKLETLSIQEGDRVVKDQIVGEFEETDMQDQIDSAEISLKNARISLENAKVSLTNAQVSLKDAELSRENAQNSLDSARDNLEDYTITSPIGGTVIEKNYKTGDNIDPTTASATGASAFLAVIYDMTRLTFDINVNELDVVKLSVGQKVTFTADALDGQTFTGVVEKININGTTVGGSTSYPVTVAVDGDGAELAGQGLLPGMNVSANIIVEEAGAVLTIPVEAVERGSYVWVAGDGALDKNGNLTDSDKLVEREVTLGRSDSEYIEILSGLEEGETVFIRTSSGSSLLISSMMGG